MRLRWAGICLLAGLLLSSCATVLNGRMEQLSVVAEKGIDSVGISRSVPLDTGMAAGTTNFLVRRSGAPLYIQYRTAAGVDSVYITGRLSAAYLLCNLSSPWLIGYLVDLASPKRFSYPETVYLYQERGQVVANRWIPHRRGDVDFIVGVPYINQFIVETSHGTDAVFGYFGLSLGMEYYYSKRRSLAITGGTAISYPIPLPLPVFAEFRDPAAIVNYLSLRNHKLLGRDKVVSVGYGVQVSRSYYALGYDFYDNSSWSQEPPKTAISAGASLSAQVRLGRYFHLGALYQPNLISNFQYAPYGHLLSLELMWKI